MIWLLVLLGIIDLIAIFLFVAAFYYVKQVCLFTRGFKEVWNYIHFGIICIILIIILNLFLIAREESSTVLQSFITSLLLLLASFFFSYGFFKLHKVFSEISLKKIFPLLAKSS